MCRQANLPILVFNYKRDGAIEKAVAGLPVGTVVGG
jgi:uridylate kinase